MEIHCCGCDEKIEARLTDGEEIYPHRQDLYSFPFWKCDACNNFVGCHHKTKNKTAPLGCIATPELKKARMEIHKILDPLWKNGEMKRKDIYSMLTEELGWKYHTASIRSMEEARTIYRLLQSARSPT